MSERQPGWFAWKTPSIRDRSRPVESGTGMATYVAPPHQGTAGKKHQAWEYAGGGHGAPAGTDTHTAYIGMAPPRAQTVEQLRAQVLTALKLIHDRGTDKSIRLYESLPITDDEDIWDAACKLDRHTQATYAQIKKLMDALS